MRGKVGERPCVAFEVFGGSRSFGRPPKGFGSLKSSARSKLCLEPELSNLPCKGRGLEGLETSLKALEPWACPGRAWRLGKALGSAEALEANVWEALKGSGSLGSLESLLTFTWGPELPRLPASAHSPCSTAPGSLSVGWLVFGRADCCHALN